jgi:hypothetical protein
VFFRIYRIATIAAAAILIYHLMLFAGLSYLITLPLTVVAMKFANENDLVKPGNTTTGKLYQFYLLIADTSNLSSLRNTCLAMCGLNGHPQAWTPLCWSPP